MTPRKLLALVCRYYGLGNLKQLAETARLDLWRYAVLDEARQVACWLLQRHCDLSEEDLQTVLKRLKWSNVFISAEAFKATRKLDEGCYSLRLAVQNIEQVMLSTFASPKL